MSEMKYKIVSFNEVYNIVKTVAEEVKSSGFWPTTVVGLARGGWVPARLMCDFLGITDLLSLKVERWLQTGKTKDETTIRYPLTRDLTGKRLLVIDDIADAGKSLMDSLEYLKKLCPEEMKVATMHYFPESKFKPDFYGEEIKARTWLIYPWNWIEDTSILIARLMSTRKEETWKFSDVSKGLEKQFDIEWERGTLKEILSVMIERGQVEMLKAGRNTVYRLKKRTLLSFKFS